MDALTNEACRSAVRKMRQAMAVYIGYMASSLEVELNIEFTDAREFVFGIADMLAPLEQGAGAGAGADAGVLTMFSVAFKRVGSDEWLFYRMPIGPINTPVSIPERYTPGTNISTEIGLIPYTDVGRICALRDDNIRAWLYPYIDALVNIIRKDMYVEDVP